MHSPNTKREKKGILRVTSPLWLRFKSPPVHLTWFSTNTGQRARFRRKPVSSGLSDLFYFTFNFMIDDYQSKYRQNYSDYQHWPQIGRPEILIEQSPDTSENQDGSS